MLTVVYAECHKLAPYAECHYAECHYAECRGAANGCSFSLVTHLLYFSEHLLIFKEHFDLPHNFSFGNFFICSKIILSQSFVTNSKLL
jgi:hypothetical protein